MTNRDELTERIEGALPPDLAEWWRGLAYQGDAVERLRHLRIVEKFWLGGPPSSAADR